MSSGLLSAPSAVHLESSSSSTSAVIPAASPEPECTMLENECFCWYFAIGSMINHVSLKLRDIHPVKSFPAKLSGWRISFDGPGGMANVFEDSTNSFHGVLHLLSRHDMTELDKIEVNYYRVPVTAQLYDGTRQRCFVYKMDEAKLDRKIPSALPSERYLDIIARGCEHYGVEKSYVDWLKCHPCSPRKKAEDFRAATVPEDAWNHIYTLEELKKCDGKDGRSACFAICGKVYKWNFTTEDTDKLDSLLSPMQKMWFNWHSTNSLGREISLRISHFLYEPRYPIAKSFEDMTTEQKLWVEDINYERMQAKATDGRSCWKIEGVMDYLIQKKEGTKIANTENSHNTTHNNLQTPLTSFDKAPPSPLTPPVNTSASN